VTKVAVLYFFLCVLAAVGWFFWTVLRAGEYPTLWMQLPRGDIVSLELCYGGRRVETADPRLIDAFYRRLIAARDPLPYATRCLPDEHPENWSVTFLRRNQTPFCVWLGVADTCGTFYCCNLHRTYSDLGRLQKLTEEVVNKYSDETGGVTP
jgi:hypothetical protein